MTPKSLLRHKRAVSTLPEMSGESSFHRLLWDDAQLLPSQAIKLTKDSKIRRVVLCSGKVYYDLYEEREKRGINDIYLLRVEQLYPFPAKALITELSRFRNAEMVWCQEEPRIWAPGRSSTRIWNGCSRISTPSISGCAIPAARRPPRRRPD